MGLPVFRSLLAVAAFAVAATACGRTVPHGGESLAPKPPAAPPELAATDLIPADLDLVVRVDLASIRRSLGPEPSRELSRRALDQTDPDVMVREALEHADVAWIGLRVSDVLSGDRVLVVDSSAGPPAPDPVAWSKTESPAEEVQLFQAIIPPPRGGTARILVLEGGSSVFVSPVEVDSVDRVLREGPDADRCEPAARGLLSLDWRAKPPSVTMQNRFPSLAALMGGIRRVRATITLRGDHLLLEGRMQCHNPAAAAKVLRFLKTITDTAKQIDRYEQVLESLEVSGAGGTVRVRWPVPPEVVLALLRGAPRDAPPSASAPVGQPPAPEPAAPRPPPSPPAE